MNIKKRVKSRHGNEGNERKYSLSLSGLNKNPERGSAEGAKEV